MKIDPSILKYFTTAAWLRGYAESMSNSDSYVKPAIIAKLTDAADMLEFVFMSSVGQEDDDGNKE